MVHVFSVSQYKSDVNPPVREAFQVDAGQIYALMPCQIGMSVQSGGNPIALFLEGVRAMGMGKMICPTCTKGNLDPFYGIHNKQA